MERNEGDEGGREAVRRRMERNEGGEVVRRLLLLSLLPIYPAHYLSPSFLSVILLITSLPPSSQSSSPPLHPSLLSIRHLMTCLLFPVILSSTSLPVFLPSPSSLLTLPR
jgi:hypothetical protein